ncbi:MAG: multifunctional oxoglutarate decarboxylase/oxoglutarate dehydrogenase thiamine pyrophosphate-binding subunit/dihydrolipoyllysine-residue succinyltransferase subunit [Acidimicrobiales bacterium]
MADDSASPIAGPNAWLVDEMFDQYRSDPASVSESWRDFFAGYTPGAAAPNSNAPATTVIAPIASPATPSPAPASAPVPTATPTEPQGTPLRGAAARIVANMEASLEVPTATSFREMPTKLLEVNRKSINGYLSRSRSGKVSFTHIIGYAIIRAIVDGLPIMNSSFSTDADGKPFVIRHENLGLGLAVDVEKNDGSRSLLVPCIKDAQSLNFAQFYDSYEELVRKVRANKLSPDDFSGVTVTLTNPGTIGTLQSVPRLMPGQGVIIGVGSLDYPIAFRGADPATIASLGLSKVMTMSSTYDHRIIQGAESGLFLKRIQELLMGEHEFYENIFESLGLPYEPVEWARDVNPNDHEDLFLEKNLQVRALLNMFRVRGHLDSDLDPLGLTEHHLHPELDPSNYGLTIWDFDREFLTGGLAGQNRMTLASILDVLHSAYCRTIGIEYMHIQDPVQKAWVQKKVEGVKFELSLEEKLHILERLNAAEALERFLGTKYLGQKRFGIEGAESAIPLLDSLLSSAADNSMQSSVLGMAHRGRLNVLVNIVGKKYEQLFTEFEGNTDPESIQGSGDVKYHLGQTGTFTSPAGNTIEVELAANPSHLEAVDPVVLGMARAKMDQIEPPGDYPVLPILVHGDAAFAGQGIVAETLNLSEITGYRVGGTIHVIINNQVGFTTAPSEARSSVYSTDVAKMVQSPIFHVNGNDPEAVIRVARLAFEYRQAFNRDVVIDMVCYRRHGHNEGDDPSYTQPLMYKRIDETRSVRKIYTEALMRRGDISLEQAEAFLDDFQTRLQVALDETRSQDAPPPLEHAPSRIFRGVLPHVDTGVSKEDLEAVFAALESIPDGFTVHPKLAKQFEGRHKMFFEDGEVDWALGEAFAFGTLLHEGTSVRVSGEDSRRGTFSHRHAALIDYDNASVHIPLTNAARNDSRLWIYDSLLSEFAVLGFEYGYSVVNKDALVVWEAQFGDFMNGAQVIIDNFLVAAEDKWQQTSGLVMLLPHGYEGQGPEHSSARIERFLTLSAGDNIQVCNATTAAQFFHLLRRQVRREVRKPLVVFTPKSLLRAKSTRSPVSDLTHGSFQEVLDDAGVADASTVRRIVFASGKIGVEAQAARDEMGTPVAIARVEQLYPWPYEAVARITEKYANADEIVWLQEEPENMGAWNHIKGRLYEAHDDTHSIRRVSRQESASPATGSSAIHHAEVHDLMEAALGGI